MMHAVQYDAAEIGKFDRIAHRFWDPHGEFKPLHALNPVRMDYMAQRCSLQGAYIADIGCGGGLLAESLARAGAGVVGLDLAPGMIEVAKLHALESGLTIDYRCAEAAALSAAEPGAFDVVSCMEMLEHVPQPATIVVTLAQLVRPGGAVFLSTINRTARAFAGAILGAEYLLGLLPKGTHEFERLIKPSELAAWGRAAGLELRDVSGIGYDPVTELASLTRDARINYLAHFERPR
jgi:2-polyprenyl-6-hydroxyphenyl methylase/3-demethylubiquinone-9 3-methyltransferase